MRIEQLGPAACRSYLVSCERSGKALLVDPLLDETDRLLEHLDAAGLELDLIVDTHTHADHLSGGADLSERTGVPYALHESTTSDRPNEKVGDGQQLEIGDGRVTVLHSPGHTPDSICLLADGTLMTGDFLFLAQDGAGRLDLPGGDAGAHWDSLQRLVELGDDVVVLPGHDYNELTHGALGDERRRNPRFQNITREEYVAWQRAVAMETPAWMLDVIAANLGQADAHAVHHAGPPTDDDPLGAACSTGGACSAGPLAAMPMILPANVHTRREGEAPPFLLDVREPWEFHGPAGRHAPGAHLIPLGELPQRLQELPADKDAEVHVICKTGGRSARAAAFLIDRGWRRVFNVATGTEGWVACGLPTER